MKQCWLIRLVLGVIMACSHVAWADVKVKDETLINKSTGNRNKGTKAYGAESVGSQDNMKRRNYLSRTGTGNSAAYDSKTLPKKFVCSSGASCDGFVGAESGVKSADIRKALAVDYSTSAELNDIANMTRQEEEKRAQEIAVYQAMLEEAYVQAAKRFETIQDLMNDIDGTDTEEPKAIWDLQARIQAEQMMLQNEQIKITALGQLQKSAADMYTQRMKEISKFRSKPDSNANSVATNAALAVARGAIAAANQATIASVNAAWEEAKAE